MKKLNILLIVTFILLLIVPTALCSTAPIVYVATDGSGDYNTDGVADEVQINQAIGFVAANSGYTTVHLKGPATYVVADSILIADNVILEGDSSVIVKPKNNHGWPLWKPMITGTKPAGFANNYAANNVVIRGFEIDGNRLNQPNIPPADKDSYPSITFKQSSHITINDMYIHDNDGDGIKLWGGSDITIFNNEFYRTCHDDVYLLYGTNAHIYNNDFSKITADCGIRLDDFDDVIIENNRMQTATNDPQGNSAIYLAFKGTGTRTMNNIVIRYNEITHTREMAVLMTVETTSSYDKSRASGVHIHHNTIFNNGDIANDPTSAIMLHGWDNTLIENNVIDGSYGNGIAAYEMYANYGFTTIGSGYTTIVRNNIITNTHNSPRISNDGYGINNYLPSTHSFVVENNNVWNNENGNYRNVASHASDFNVNPLFVDPANNDYRLQSNSPIINAGMGVYGSDDSAPAPSNTAPVLNAIGDRTVDEGNTLSSTVSATDVNGDSLTYSATGLPSGASIGSSTGAFSWTPSEGQAGTHSVTFEVTDGQLTDSEEVTITVIRNTSAAPSLVYDNRLRESTPDTTLAGDNYIDIGHDTDAGRYRDVMWFNLSTYNTTDTVSNATLSLYWYYPENSPRNQDTVVEIYRAAEWNPGHVSWNNNAAGTPWDNAGGDWFDVNNVAQGSEPYASITFDANDLPDNRYYEFDITELVQDYVSGEYDNTGFFLKAQNEHDNYIAFYSSDWSNEDQRPKLTIAHTTETEPVSNNAPILNSIGEKSVEEGSALSFTVSASDADDDSLAHLAIGLPSGASIDSSTGAFSWTPSEGQAGTYSVTFEVTDGQLTDSEEVIITVNVVPATAPSLVYDNRLRESTPDTTLAGDNYIDIGHDTDAGRYRDVMWFDLSAYNTTDTVSNATLSLYWYYPENSPRDQDTVVEIYRAADWNPGHVSWNNNAAGTPWNNPGGDWFDTNNVAQGSTPYASITFDANDLPDNRYYEFDITELVQDYVSGEYDNTGFFLKAQNEYGNYIAFYSSDWSNPGQRPKLTIDHATESDSVIGPENPSDVNEDGIVNVLDITLVGQNIGTSAESSPRCDVNQDGLINILDLTVVGQNFGKTVN
ncbi:DNRLRE domain-containing protein [Methanococcoides sp. SA1]|nr:DNRLRE domain-containing protein [Methanococcoides sp. SA1]